MKEKNDQSKRINDAKKNLDEINKKISPFIRRYHIENIDPKGNWEKTPDSINVLSGDIFSYQSNNEKKTKKICINENDIY